MRNDKGVLENIVTMKVTSWVMLLLV